MKRASLSIQPSAPKSAPTDLTDRLLDREGDRASEKAPPSPRPTRRRSKPAAPKAPTGTFEPKSQPPVLETSAASDGGDASLEGALKHAASAAEALEAAARQAPARYEVALRYRLDALAHHLRQVADFVGGLARR